MVNDMKIAIFTNNYLPNPYGVSASIETFRHELERLGHTVFIFAPKWPGYTDENKNVFRYPAIDIEIKIRFPIAIPYSLKISKIIKKLDIDVIHAQHPNLLGGAAMKWARKLARRRGGKKIPLVFTWHTLYDQYTNFVPFLPSKLSAWYIIKKAVNFANKADAVVAPTDSIIPVLKKWGVKKEIVPVATGVMEKEFENPDRKLIRDKFNIADDEILLLLISRLTSEKNVEFVLASIKDILKNRQNAKLLISGGGYLVPKIKEFIKQEKLEEKIILTGVVERKEIKNVFAAGDIFVYGSKSETQGMILTEAMYSGLPVVAVNATGSNSLVLNNASGFLVKEDKKEFGNAVEKLINDKDLRQRFGEAGKKIAQDNFTSAICAKKMLGVYEKCLNH